MEQEVLLTILSDAVIPLVMLVLTPIVTGLATRALDELQRRTDIKLTDQQERQVEKLVEDAIHYAEEKARKVAKGEGRLMPGKDKMKTAVEHFSRRAQKAGLDDVVRESSEEIAERIEAKLFKRRLEAGDGGDPRWGAPVSRLNVDERAVDSLKEAGFETLRDIRDHGVDKLEGVDGIGQTYAREIVAALPPRPRVTPPTPSEE